MVTRTKVLNVRITEKQYEELEELVEIEGYTSKDEFVRELLCEKINDFVSSLHEKAERDREKHILLETYGKSRGLER